VRPRRVIPSWTISWAALHGARLDRPLGVDADSPDATLALAFAKDDDELLARAVVDIPDRFLRRATALFSPFDEAGLGSWYWLRRIGEIDDLFLFFRKAAFLAASGPRAAESTAPAP